MSLSEITNKHYRDKKAQWTTAEQMYTGEFEPSQLLPRGPYEAERVYKKRVQIADHHRHTATLIGRLSGSLMQRGEDVERETGEVPADLLSSIGPDGESYRQQLSKLADYLLLFDECWIWVRPSGGEAEMHVVNPLRVPRWGDGRALMLGQRETSSSLMERQETETTYTLHKAGSYETYVEAEDDPNRDRKLVEELSGVYGAEGEAYFVNEDGRPHAPLIRLQMPWESPFGLAIAESHQQLFKMRNELDMGSTAGLNSSIATITGVTDEDREKKIVTALKDGDQLVFMPEEASMDAFELGTGNIEAAEARVEAKRKDMYRTAYQTLEEASRSATESAIEHSQGPAAALATLAGTMESAEETILRFVEQSLNLADYGGPNPQKSSITITWPRDFQRVELQGEDE